MNYTPGWLPRTEREQRRSMQRRLEGEHRFDWFEAFTVWCASLGLLTAVSLLVFGAWRLLLWLVAG